MTINEMQAAVNNMANDWYDRFCEEFDSSAKTVTKKRLRSCDAYVYKDANGYIALRSFKTFVAFITPDGDFVDVLRLVYHYTSMSAYHIAKFRNDYATKWTNYYTYRSISK